jgi:hypothetical protein
MVLRESARAGSADQHGRKVVCETEKASMVWLGADEKGLTFGASTRLPGTIRQSMAKEIPSVGNLRRKSEVSDDEIEGAAAAYLKDEGAKPFAFKSGHTIDVAKAVEMHPQAKKLLADKTSAPGLRRTMVMTAVIMGFPVQR